jgi:polysaccharide export outer membrane protein
MNSLMKVLIIIASVLLSSATWSEESLVISNYKLDSGDTIRITIFGEDDMLLETRLDDTGVINYQFLDEIQVKGMSVKQLEQYITNGLKPDYYVNPVVQVTVLEYRPFFINGAVNNPGSYPYQPGLNISKAITLAGGLTERGSEGNIEVIRATDSTETALDVKMNDKVFPGDLITVGEGFF